MNMEDKAEPKLDFSNTEIAFSYKSDKELKQTYRLFKWMSSPRLISVANWLAPIAARMPFHIFDPIIRYTIFKQFVGGVNLFECQKLIDQLHNKNTFTILDYSVEAKNSDDDFQHTLEENLRAIEFAYSNPDIPVISTKLTGYVPITVLEKKQAGNTLSISELRALERLEERFAVLCKKAYELGVAVFIDAEESWIQEPIDDLVEKYMEIYNKERPIIYNTYQMYRKGRLAYFQAAFERAREKNYILGAKLVRGAYMVKEIKRAQELGIESPIQETKQKTDEQYNDSIRFCVQFPEQISLCNSSHNLESTQLQVELMAKNNIANDHPHMNFCQLLGMSDNLTFNLAAHSYNVAKYVPYGPIKDVIPYLIRRAQENTSITGEMGREFKLIQKEMSRRGLL